MNPWAVRALLGALLSAPASLTFAQTPDPAHVVDTSRVAHTAHVADTSHVARTARVADTSRVAHTTHVADTSHVADSSHVADTLRADSSRVVVDTPRVAPKVASVRAKSSGSLLYLEHADYLLTETSGGVQITHLRGNVHFLHEGTRISSRDADWNRSNGILDLWNDVHLADSGRTLIADHVVYRQRDRVGEAFGHVTLADSASHTILTGGHGLYDRGASEWVVDTKPHMIQRDSTDTSSSTTLDATVLRYDRTRNLSWAIGKAKAVLASPHDTIIVDSDSLQMMHQDSLTTAFGHVRITRGDLVGTGAQGDYRTYGNRGELRLTGEPQLTSRTDVATGESIWVYFTARKVDSLVVRGKARAQLHDEPDSAHRMPPPSELLGSRLVARFARDTLRTVTAVGQASSTYWPAPTDSGPQDVNRIQGDSLFGRSDGSRIVYLAATGQTRGQYIAGTNRALPETTNYQGALIEYHDSTEVVDLTSNAQLTQKDLFLTAENVHLEKARHLVTASGVADTADTMTGFRGTPVLVSQRDTLRGIAMQYNTKTRKGRVNAGRTRFEKGWYRGVEVAKVTDSVFYARDVDFTSCDHEKHPHYHFHAGRLKMVKKQIAIAEPIVLYIGPIPIFALPFYVFTLTPGRHSGILPFNVGNFERGDRFVKNLGYYWAASDYWDLATWMDLDQTRGLFFNAETHYALRYVLDGSVLASYNLENAFDPTVRNTNEWALTLNHEQTIDDNTRLTASAQFQSIADYYGTSLDALQRVNRELRSSFAITHNEGPWNLYLAFDRSQTFADPVSGVQARTALTFPSLTWSRPSGPLVSFFGLDAPTSPDGSQPWWAQVQGSYTGRALRVVTTIDTATTQGAGVAQDASLTWTAAYAPYIRATPSIAYHEAWFDRDGNNVTGFQRQGSWNAGINVATTLYGLVQFPWGPIRALRHEFTPSIGIAYTPAITDSAPYPNWISGISAVAPRISAASIVWSVNNTFQMKVPGSGTNDDTRIDLGTFAVSGSYNPNAYLRKHGGISASFRTLLPAGLSVDWSGSYDPYLADGRTFRPHVTAQTVRASGTFTFDIPRIPFVQPPDSADSAATRSATARADSLGALGLADTASARANALATGASPEATSSMALPTSTAWANPFTLTVDYSLSRSSLTTINPVTQSLLASVSTSLTRNWKIDYTVNYDPQSGRFIEETWAVKRDLHCWEMSFNWVPRGTRSGYYFRIAVKELPDVKLERSEGGVSQTLSGSAQDILQSLGGQ